MQLSIYQVDAFTCKNSPSYSGNPAAVVPLKEWLNDKQMQDIAAENNLAETAFFSKQKDNSYYIRWFTPTNEVDLCGHATLASAHVIHQILGDTRKTLPFKCGVGDIFVNVVAANLYELKFPQRKPTKVHDKTIIAQIAEAINHPVQEVYQARDLIAVLKNTSDVISCQPRFSLLKEIDTFAVIVTASSDDPTLDFVSRFFAPQQGIPEDPVTGSSFCSLAPLWAEKLEKTMMSAKQCSERGGQVTLKLTDQQVLIKGHTFEYMQGTINLI